MTPAFKTCASSDEVMKCIAVRAMVFCGEQGIPYALEHDEHDAGALHVLGELDGEPIAAGRLRFFAEYAKLERIVVRSAWRGRGFGHQLTEFMITLCQERGFACFRLGAQVQWRSFYERHGFRVIGEQFLDAGILHWPMMRQD